MIPGIQGFLPSLSQEAGSCTSQTRKPWHRRLLKSTPHSDPGCSEARTKLPVGKPSKKTCSCPIERGVWGITNPKTSMRNDRDVTFVLTYLLHCFLYVTQRLGLHPSPGPSLCIRSLSAILTFLAHFSGWPSFGHSFIHSASIYELLEGLG